MVIIVNTERVEWTADNCTHNNVITSFDGEVMIMVCNDCTKSL